MCYEAGNLHLPKDYHQYLEKLFGIESLPKTLLQLLDLSVDFIDNKLRVMMAQNKGYQGSEDAGLGVGCGHLPSWCWMQDKTTETS